MKKIVKRILAIGCMAIMAVGMTACMQPSGTAYDVAVKNGFQGTEKEWLLSLVGESGKDGRDGESLDAEKMYDAAVAKGYDKDFLAFCQELDIECYQQNDTVQISENTLSIVSIYCGYSKTTSTGGGIWGPRSNAVTEYGSQAGSGVIVSLNKEAGDAYIITNYHVLYNLESDQKGILEDIWVYTYGAYNGFDAKDGDTTGDGIKATYVGGAMEYDIAILKIKGSEKLQKSQARAAKMGNSDEVKLGEETYVIGNPAGAGIAVTNGVLSVQSEYITMSAMDNSNRAISYRVMRTSAAINGGNSGGGMFNVQGELIGIVNAKSASSQTDNMGYALPITQVKAVYDNILANEGKVKRAMLGIVVAVKASKPVLDEDGNVSIQEEFCVSTEAEEGSAAYNKLSEGEIFLSMSINGEKSVVFTRQYQLTEGLLLVRKGNKVTFTLRNSSGQEERVEIVFDKDDYFTSYA